MFHACALRFDMIYNLEKFFVFGIELNNALVRTGQSEAHRIAGNTNGRSYDLIRMTV